MEVLTTFSFQSDLWPSSAYWMMLMNKCIAGWFKAERTKEKRKRKATSIMSHLSSGHSLTERSERKNFPCFGMPESERERKKKECLDETPSNKNIIEMHMIKVWCSRWSERKVEEGEEEKSITYRVFAQVPGERVFAIECSESLSMKRMFSLFSVGFWANNVGELKRKPKPPLVRRSDARVKHRPQTRAVDLGWIIVGTSD